MIKAQEFCAIAALLVLGQAASGIEYQKSVIAGAGMILGCDLPCEVPEGIHLVERSEVHGMPADRFLDSVARVCGLALRFEKDKLVFEKPPEKTKPTGIDGNRRESTDAGR